MSNMDASAVLDETETTAETKEAISAQVMKWRQQMEEKRFELFRTNWKNRRSKPGLQSWDDAKSFQFIVEWYDEFGDLVDRDKMRRRLDALIEMGLDVNAPKEELPRVV